MNQNEPKEVKRQYNELCRGCHGTGERDGKQCPTCEGSGRVEVTKKITITIKPLKS